jgi:short-subunit dehydrogenase
VTLQILAAGGSVAGVDLNAAGLDQTRDLAAGGSRFTVHRIDITDRTAVEELPGAVVAAHGQVDGVVNVAGVIQKFVKIIDLPYEEVDKVMRVNFYGVLHMCKAFLPSLLTRPQAAIVNVSSMGAYAPVPGQAVYGASKAAVMLLTEALYAELLDTTVAVTVIYPGAIGTNIAANSGVSIGNMSADDGTHKVTSPVIAGQVIVDAIRKGKFRATIGSDAAMMDKISRLDPKRAARLIAKRMGDLLK